MNNTIIIINIILLLLSSFFFIGSFFFLKQIFILKKALDEIIIKIMKDHETFILNINKHFIRELKNSLNNIEKIEKDINITRIGFRNLLQEYYNKKLND